MLVLNVTLRDYARFGRLFLEQGRWNGEQVVPAQWVRDSITPDAPHLQPGKNVLSDTRLGYGYQWWIPETRRGGDFMAVGVHGQQIYINPGKRVIIVKNSADPFYTAERELNYVITAGMQNIAENLK